MPWLHLDRDDLRCCHLVRRGTFRYLNHLAIESPVPHFFQEHGVRLNQPLRVINQP